MKNTNETPLANRKHIGIFGSTNAGKSLLFNRILNQELSIVSDIHGTTTDPVIKGIELIPYGPVAFIDTAGFGDISALGEERQKKTKQILERCDYILYVVDIEHFEETTIENAIKLFQNTPYTFVFTKIDTLSDKSRVISLQKMYPTAQFINYQDEDAVNKLKLYLAKELEKLGSDAENMLAGIATKGNHVVMVVPVDSEAPKGRLILPQVTFLRNCLDNDVVCTVTKEETLEKILHTTPKVDLVVTDSQIFKSVADIVPKQIPLTSFSMLLARQKGDLKVMLEACDAIANLKAGDKILMLEACTHNHTHEDIGRVKIPMLLQKKVGFPLEFDYFVGYDFPNDLSSYKLAIHCGGCMITKKAVLSRIEKCIQAGLPITNYGVILSFLSGIKDRASEVFF